MTRDEYVAAVGRVLNEHSQRAVAELTAALALIPPKAQGVSIDIFVDQDGEGFLTVRVGLDGPDLYVLNRAISARAELFDTRMSASRFDPALPHMDQDVESFSVQDALTDCAASWVQSLWRMGNFATSLPVVVASPEGYGTTVPRQLQ